MTTPEGQAPDTTAQGAQGQQAPADQAQGQQASQGQPAAQSQPPANDPQGQQGQGQQQTQQNSNPQGQQQQQKPVPQQAPEKYEISVPEGITLGDDVLGGFQEVAKKHNLSQEAAQDFISTLAPQIAQQQKQVLDDAAKQVREGWISQSKADPEFGGDKLGENMAVAKETFKRFGTPELAKFLDESGLGDHPELIRWAHRVGKAISEDGHVAGNKGGESPGDARRLYAASNMNP